MQYPAPGLPELADEVSDVVHPTWVGADVDSWGIDHGTWSVLVHAFPDASIPVVQLTINADKPLDYHLELGAKLAPLRERGVLIVGQRQRGAQPARHELERSPTTASTGPSGSTRPPRTRMLTDPTEFATLDAHARLRLAVPTPDHFIPALYLAGLAGAEGTGTLGHPRPDRRLCLRVAVHDRLHARDGVSADHERRRITAVHGRSAPRRLQHLSTSVRSAGWPRSVQAVPDAHHPDEEAHCRRRDRGDQAEHLRPDRDDREGRADDRRNRVQPALQHRRDPPHEHVAQRAAADTR